MTIQLSREQQLAEDFANLTFNTDAKTDAKITIAKASVLSAMATQKTALERKITNEITNEITNAKVTTKTLYSKPAKKIDRVDDAINLSDNPFNFTKLYFHMGVGNNYHTQWFFGHELMMFDQSPSGFDKMSFFILGQSVRGVNVKSEMWYTLTLSEITGTWYIRIKALSANAFSINKVIGIKY